MVDDFYKQFQAEINKLKDCRDEALLLQIQRVIGVAESHGDLDAAADWYMHLLRAASTQGRFDIELSAFASLRHLYQREAKFKYLREKLLWYYKWIVERLPEHVDISLELIDTTFAQMIEFYKSENESLRPVYSLRCRCESFMGHAEKAAEYLELWDNTGNAQFDDCPACQTHGRVQYLLDVNKQDEAIAAAEPIFRGEQHCEEVPSATFSRLLLPMVRAEKIELAERMHRAVLRHVRKVPKMISYLCNHVVYLAFTGRASQANRLAAVMLVRGNAATNSYYRLCAWRAAWLWLALRKHDGESTVRLPQAVFKTANALPIESAIERCRNESYALSAAFDRRDGNDHFTAPLDAMTQMLAGLQSQA